jgi:hypothetical protein
VAIDQRHRGFNGLARLVPLPRTLERSRERRARQRGRSVLPKTAVRLRLRDGDAYVVRIERDAGRRETARSL